MKVSPVVLGCKLLIDSYVKGLKKIFIVHAHTLSIPSEVSDKLLSRLTTNICYTTTMHTRSFQTQRRFKHVYLLVPRLSNDTSSLLCLVLSKHFNFQLQLQVVNMS